MTQPQPKTRLFATAAALAVVFPGLLACDEEPSSKPVSETSAPQPIQQTSASVASPVQPPAPAATRAIQPGYEAVLLKDKVPICVFASYGAWQEVKFAKDVKPQTLTPDSRVVIGAFPSWCVHEKCDARPSLQTATEREGNTLTVTTVYSGERKLGTECTEDCRPITAAGASVALEAGSYSVHYGDETFQFQIPGLLSSPCFELRE